MSYLVANPEDRFGRDEAHIDVSTGSPRHNFSVVNVALQISKLKNKIFPI